MDTVYVSQQRITLFKLLKLLNPRRSIMMPPLSLQINRRSRVTLNFDLLTAKVEFHALVPWTTSNLNQNKFIRFQNIVLTSSVTDERRDKRTDEWTYGDTNGEVDNIIPAPACLVWRRHKNQKTVNWLKRIFTSTSVQLASCAGIIDHHQSHFGTSVMYESKIAGVKKKYGK